MARCIPILGYAFSSSRRFWHANQLTNLTHRVLQFGRQHQQTIFRVGLVLLLTASYSTVVLARSPIDERRKAAKKFKKGDKVEVTWGNEKTKGVVTEVTDFGQVRVSTKDKPGGWNYQPDRVRLLTRKAKPAAEAATGEESNPFATDDEKYQEIGKRTWSDKSGKFRIEATVVRIDGPQVVLKRTDNKEVSVERAKLSDDDQAILNKVAGSSESEDLDADEMPEEEEAPDAPDIESTEVDLAAATPLDLGAPTDWKYTPDPDPAPRQLSRVGLPQLDFFDHVETVLVSAGPMAYISISNRSPGQKHSTKIFACDLEKRKLASQGKFYSKQLPLDVSPAGTKLLARSNEFGFGKNGTLVLYSLDGFKTKPLLAWKPDDRHGWHDEDIEWARFLDDDHLLSLSHGGQLTLWDTSSKLQAVYTAAAGRGAQVAFSGNRNFLFVRTDSGIAVIKPLSGESVGFIGAPGGWLAAMALRPDGKKLAVTDAGRIRVWNLETREVERDFCLSGGFGANSIAWCDDQRIVTNHGAIIDVERRVLLWTYTGCDSPLVAVGEGVWAVVGKRAETGVKLVGTKLPHGDVIRAAEKFDADTLLVIKPGMEVSLQTSFSGSAEQQQRVKAALTKRLEEAGMKIVPQSPVTLVATIKSAPSTKVQYRKFGSFETTEHTVPQHILELAYKVNGKPVWTYTTHSWAPSSLQMQQGETIDQALARETKQKPEQFESIFVPGYVAAAPAGGAGSSPWPGG